MKKHSLLRKTLRPRLRRLTSASPKRTLLSLAVCLSLAVPTLLTAATQNPKNIGTDLQKVVARDLAAKSGKTIAGPGVGSNVDMGERSRRDAQGRLLVTVYMKNPAAREAVAKLKDVVIKAVDVRGGVMDVYVPAARVTQLANTAGVASVHLSLAPVFDVGATTSQGVHQHRVDEITNQDDVPVSGITGAGIMVGLLSNSFDTNGGSIGADEDIASGDLPGPGNPNNSTPVLVLEDFPASSDEGRAMAQIVHDMAPMADLAFATANTGEVGFGNNIRALADAGSQVIVDDVIYFAEGMFQDTIVARAVDDVAAQGVAYFSSAGNRPATQGYYSDFRLVPADGSATDGTNIDLSSVPPELYAGGFHDFNPAPGDKDIAQSVLIGGSSTGTLAAIFDFQWDDPYNVNPVTIGANIVSGTGTVPPGGFDDFTFPGTAGDCVQITVTDHPDATIFDSIIELIAPDNTSIIVQDTGIDELLIIGLEQTGIYTVRVTQFGTQTGGMYDYSVDEVIDGCQQLVTTDFNILFFDGNGAFIGATGEDNIQTGRPVEIAQILPSQTTAGNIVQVVFARSNTPPPDPQPASRVRYVTFTSGEPQEYFTFNETPITFGHNSAAGGNGVAAYAFYPPFIPEGFSSPGPSIIVFDKDNNRLPEPEVRQKPDMAAMDGANNTFFSADASQDKDVFPNFFGTSAAAPHAAAIAALVLEANGGPGSVTPEQMRGVLQRSAFPHDLDPYQSRGTSRAAGASRVAIRMMSDGSSLISTMNPNAFEVVYRGQGSLNQLVFNPQATDATAGNTTEPVDTEVGFTSRPGLVFDNRPPTLGFPFTLGNLKGVMSSDISGTLSNQAPPPALVGNHFYTLTIDIAPGALTSREGFNFGVDRDEADAFGPNGTVGGNSADLLGANVLIPEGTLAPGGMTFSGMTSEGAFDGVFRNKIGSGWSVLDGYGFINAEAAVNEPLQ